MFESGSNLARHDKWLQSGGPPATGLAAICRPEDDHDHSVGWVLLESGNLDGQVAADGLDPRLHGVKVSSKGRQDLHGNPVGWHHKVPSDEQVRAARERLSR